MCRGPRCHIQDTLSRAISLTPRDFASAHPQQKCIRWEKNGAAPGRKVSGRTGETPCLPGAGVGACHLKASLTMTSATLPSLGGPSAPGSALAASLAGCFSSLALLPSGPPSGCTLGCCKVFLGLFTSVAAKWDWVFGEGEGVIPVCLGVLFVLFLYLNQQRSDGETAGGHFSWYETKGDFPPK